MADKYLLESGAGFYLLEDGSGVLLLEISVPVIIPETPPGGHGHLAYPDIGFPHRRQIEVEQPKRKYARVVSHPTPYELARDLAKAREAERLARLAAEAERERLAEAERERLAELARLKAERERRAKTTADIREAKLPKIKAAKGVARGTCEVVAFSILPPEGFAEISEDEFMVLAMAA